MAVVLSHSDVKRQSENVFRQFGEKWMRYSQINSRLPNRADPNDLRNCGLGKFAVLAAMGASLEEHIPILKKYRDRFDLITCDKGFTVLMEQGIKPDYVQLCDCNIPYRWMEPWVKDTEGVKLLATCYANIEWTTRWKGPIYFYTNKDALDTQRKFTPILGNPESVEDVSLERAIQSAWGPNVRVIPAGSNVSNAMLIFMAGVDEHSQVNWAGYEHYFLTGYDYSWRPNGKDVTCKTGNYYAFENPTPKRHYMSHRTMLDINGDIINTSENLLFSAKWLYSYLTSFNLPVTNCSGRGILEVPRRGDLQSMLAKCSPSSKARDKVIRAIGDISRAMELRQSAVQSFEEARRSMWDGKP